MCTSDITKKKFCKLLGEVYFYRIVIWCLFFFSGYEPFSVKGFLKMIFPFFTVADNFTGCFLLFYLLIPFLNKLIHGRPQPRCCAGAVVIVADHQKTGQRYKY